MPRLDPSTDVLERVAVGPKHDGTNWIRLYPGRVQIWNSSSGSSHTARETAGPRARRR